MYGRDLRLEGRVYETMPCEGGLFVEKRRDDSCFEGLTASACATPVVSIRSCWFMIELLGVLYGVYTQYVVLTMQKVNPPLT